MLLKASRYSPAIDVYAYGCILAELVLCRPLFTGTSEVDQLNKILAVLGTPEQADWAEGYRLAKIKNLVMPHYEGSKLH